VGHRGEHQLVAGDRRARERRKVKKGREVPEFPRKNKKTLREWRGGTRQKNERGRMERNPGRQIEEKKQNAILLCGGGLSSETI